MSYSASSSSRDSVLKNETTKNNFLKTYVRKEDLAAGVWEEQGGEELPAGANAAKFCRVPN